MQGEKLAQSILAGFGKNGQIAAIDDPRSGGCRRDHQAPEIRIQFGRSAGQVDHSNSARTHDLDHQRGGCGVHLFLARRTRVHMAVLTRLVAAVAEIDLQCFQNATTQLRKIGIAKKRKSSVHSMSRELFCQPSR